ncbi:hypothetical protein BDZ94DRAFT_1341863 [Collybia nuda]|uniref:DUF7770 domain-containing protein n=1 Tax=Collybia nuda TaxID=64659 RepID=A0A9P5YCZ1_9AGAR|nr:hypothetical protein BDZ94DRAFT_1341863 [Collybia nuda]
MSHQYPQFPGSFVGEGVDDYILDAPVRAICAAVGGAIRNSAGIDLYHWRLFLVYNENTSIVFDMAKNSTEDLQSVPRILRKPYAVTNTAIKVVELPLASATLTARKLWEKLYVEGCLQYSYSSSGEGCRAWVSKTICVWESHGFLAKGAHENVLWPVISRVWTDPNHGYPNEMVHGGFH